MLKLKIPNNNIKEREYILHIIFNEFLGLEYRLYYGSDNYEIGLENGKVLVIQDTFFNNYPENLSYLKFECIPKTIKELDIFSASFFMLTRWEEHVNKNKDIHNRFPANESLAYKEGFLDRPIVNEYLEELKSLLLNLDKSLEFKKREYRLFLTHDVDIPFKYLNIKNGLREIVIDLKNRKIKKAIEKFYQKIKVYFGLEKDPFDTFDDLMNISEKIGAKSYFFFMGRGVTRYDSFYDKKRFLIKKLIKKVKNKKHYIGIHPSYNAYNNYEQFRVEKEDLEESLKYNIKFGRCHYLRFEVPVTWQIWEDNHMEWDSTVGYADKEGFRCGVCYEYSVFNVLTQKKLHLKEKPLIVMDSSFLFYQENITKSVMKDKIKILMERVKKYKGDFVFLWHNSSFNTPEWENYKNVYEEVLLDEN